MIQGTAEQPGTLEVIVLVMIVVVFLAIVYVYWDYYSGGCPFEHIRERLNFIFK